MSTKLRQKTLIQNPVLNGAPYALGKVTTKGTTTGLSRIAMAAGIRRERIAFRNVVVPVAAADDFGSIKLLDYPNGNLMVLGAVVALTAAIGGGIAALANVDIAVGSAVASAATLASTMLDVVPKIDVTAGGVVAGKSTGTEALKVLTASSSALYLNVGGSTITTDGTVTLNGYVDVLFIDLGP